MRPTLRRTLRTLSPLAIIVASMLALATQAPALVLYDGSYATDLSSSTPSGLSPASGIALPYPSTNLHLSWSQVPGADKYQLQVARQNSTSADCNVNGAFQIDNVVLTVTTSQNEWVPTLSSPEEGEDIWTGAYCWRVRTTGKGYGDWSTGQRFTRTWASNISGLRFYNDHDGPIPRTSASADFAAGSTLTRNAGYLTWDALPGASEYEVQVSPTSSFSASSIIASRDGVSDNEVLLLHLPDDTYFWRVRGISPNGTEGAWSSGTNTFTVEWYEPSWSSPAKLYPADSSTQTELRIGWTPMPGASHYEYQISTNSGCFWEPTAPEGAPRLYGSWTLLPAIKDPAAGTFLATQDPSWAHCRLSKVDATTINNWVTLKDAIDEPVFGYLANDCWDEANGEPTCERAHFPDNVPDDQSAVLWRGPAMSANQEDGLAYQLYWRVRPVYSLSQASETGWKVQGNVKVYGSWTRYTQSGANREHRFEIGEPSTAPWTSITTRCENDPGINPTTNQCLEHAGSAMQADHAVGVGNSATMQVPVVSWKPFPGAGGYIVQYARDPLFNTFERTVYVPGVQSTGWGFQQSYIPTNGMIDNAQGTGMWWRVIPCNSQIDDITVPTFTNCAGLYSDGSPGLPPGVSSLAGFSDMAVAQTFTKRVQIQTSIHENFEGSTPLIRWALDGATSTDYTAWSAGISGAHHYEVQLARDPFMTKDEFTLQTTIPRIAPFALPAAGGSSTAGQTTELADGIWFYRVRPIDRNNIEGSWSDVKSFNKRVPAPVPSGTNGASGAGVAVAWSAVQGAGSYELQWSLDSGFEKDVLSGTTLQTSFRIPDTTLGTYHWRVRAVVDGIQGQWSAQDRHVVIVAPTTIRYALNRDTTLAGDKVQVTGELRVAGTQTNGERLRLQRKTGGCDSATGQYVDSSTATTGDNADDGMVNIPARVLQNTCFRYAWSGTDQVRYSAPIPVSVMPNVAVSSNRKVVRRGKPFCVSITSNVAVNGRARLQYRIAGRWQTSRSTMLRDVKKSRLCATITKAGRYSTRILVDKLNHPTQGWKQFEDVTSGAGTIRVNDLWQVKRGR